MRQVLYVIKVADRHLLGLIVWIRSMQAPVYDPGNNSPCRQSVKKRSADSHADHAQRVVNPDFDVRLNTSGSEIFNITHRIRVWQRCWDDTVCGLYHIPSVAIRYGLRCRDIPV